MQYTDLILLDIKHIDPEGHLELTGQPNDNILAMARELSDMGKPVWIRHVLVPERNDKDEYLHRLADFIHTLNNVERVEVLPYHTLGVFKWEKLEFHIRWRASDHRKKNGWKMQRGFFKPLDIPAEFT